MHPTPARTPAWLSTWMAASVAIFFLLMLSAPSGYSVGGGLLFLGGVAIWLAGTGRRSGAADASAPPAAAWSGEDRTLCWLLLAFFLTNAAAVLWHADSGKYLDQGIRYALAIPVLLGLRRARLRLDWMWAGLALGLAGAAAVAWWQIGHIGVPRAEGFLTSAIPFGDIALVMAFWCLMGAILPAVHRRPAWAVFLLAGALAGIYAFIASATRGGLVAVPIFAVLAAVALLRRQYLRPLLGGCAVMVAGAAIVMTALPAGQIAEGRYASAVAEWQAYTRDGNAANNVGSRLEAWKSALISIPERPLLGWGHEEYDSHLQGLIETGRIHPFVGTLSNTHNNFIEIWLHQGTLGLFAFLALLITSCWYFCRRLQSPDLTVRVLACCGASLPAAFAAFGLTQVILGRNNGVMFFVLSLAILWAAMRQAEASGGVQPPLT
ncbi:O-antigen ligase family protein [Castellaniella sp. S9]|uniref:O-antigen ligase family protein n=1 Tax=Castellaniella sp. S9 TaxID=2993652 RepID=UPI0022B2E5E5|nr:O-antigen ligase family protein [Castellaniella sp. S9]